MCCASKNDDDSFNFTFYYDISRVIRIEQQILRHYHRDYNKRTTWSIIYIVKVLKSIQLCLRKYLSPFRIWAIKFNV